MRERIITGGFWAECPDCNGRRYLQGHDVNRHGEAYVWFGCDAACDEGLADLDIILEWDETWTAEENETGRRALYVWQFEEVEEAD